MVRPRTVSLEPEEMIKLGEEMVEWVYENKPLHLSQWYSIEKFITDKDWDAMTRVPEFLPYYEKCMKIIGLQYLDKNSNVRDGISQRWQRVYFRDLRAQEDQDKDDDLKREKEVASIASASVEDKLSKMTAEIAAAREALASRRASESTS